MILCRNGHENADGATVCSVCQAPIIGDEPEKPPLEQELEPRQPQLTLSRASLEAEPGGEAAADIRVENPGGVQDEYVLEVLGEAAPFTSVEPSAFGLEGGTHGVARLTIRVPESATGVLPFEVRVRSQQLPDAPASTVGLVEIGTPPTGVTLAAELRPVTSKGRTSGRHELAVRNPASTPATTQPVGVDPQGAVSVAVTPLLLSIPAGETGTAQVTVTPLRQLWIGRARRLPFRVEVAPDVAVEGELVQTSRVPVWLVLLAAALLISTVVAVVAAGDDEPRVAIPDVSGQPAAAAENMLEAACEPFPCFQVQVVERLSRAPKGQAISTNPPAQTPVAPGSQVELRISRGIFVFPQIDPIQPPIVNP